MRIEIPCGLMVPSALRLALEEANRIGSRVQFKINGVDMEVAPSSDINDVFWSYDRKREVLCSGNRSTKAKTPAPKAPTYSEAPVNPKVEANPFAQEPAPSWLEAIHEDLKLPEGLEHIRDKLNVSRS